MQLSKRLVTFLFLSFFFAQSLWAEKWALLIGINDYIFDGIPDLRGCEHDVNLMQTLLTTKYDFSQENIKSVLSGEATKENIVAAIRAWLIEKPKADDTVVLYYSGHGVQIADKSGDEDDGFDEALCPTDMMPNEAKTEFVNFLLDDELDQLLSQIPTTSVTIIFDCCHSGTATKSLGLVSVGMSTTKVVNRDLVLVEASSRQKPTPNNISSSAAPLGTGRDLEDLQHVVITGCQDHEVSQERVWYTPEGGSFRSGVLTKLLTDELNRSPSNLTYADLMENIRKNIGTGAVQTPQLHGDQSRAVFSASAVAKPYVLVASVAGESAHLRAGSIHGVTKGSIYAVYPDGEVEFAGPGYAKVQIAEVGLETAKAIPVGERPFVVEGLTETPPPTRRITPKSRAVEIEHAFPQDQLYLWIDAPGPEEVQAFMQHLGVENAVAVSDEQRADFVVKLTPTFGNITGKLISAEGRIVLEETGPSIQAVSGKLRRPLEREVLIKLLSTFRNPNPPFKLKVWVDRRTHPIYRIGEELSMFFESERDCYLTLLNVDSEGYVTMMFPNKYQRDSRIVGGRTYAIPSRSSGMAFKIKVYGPPGREFIMALATTKPLSSPLFQITDQSEILADLTGAKLGTQLVKIVNESLRGGDTATSSSAVPTDEWVTDSVIVVIEE